MGRFQTTVSDFHISCPWDLMEMRKALQHVNHFVSVQQALPDLAEDLDLVLSEAMTNIVRHGTQDAEGVIECFLVLEGGGVQCRLTDTGRAFDPSGAGLCAPEPKTFPEGGYGWFLIRSLTSHLSYAREGNLNVLHFYILRCG